MKTRKSGLVLFIIGMAFVASWWVRPAYHYMSWNEVNRTIWAVTSPLFGLWASSAPPGSNRGRDRDTDPCALSRPKEPTEDNPIERNTYKKA